MNQNVVTKFPSLSLNFVTPLTLNFDYIFQLGEASYPPPLTLPAGAHGHVINKQKVMELSPENDNAIFRFAVCSAALMTKQFLSVSINNCRVGLARYK